MALIVGIVTCSPPLTTVMLPSMSSTTILPLNTATVMRSLSPARIGTGPGTETHLAALASYDPITTNGKLPNSTSLQVPLPDIEPTVKKVVAVGVIPLLPPPEPTIGFPSPPPPQALRMSVHLGFPSQTLGLCHQAP